MATPVQVNPEALPPDAFHLAPGLATGTRDHVFVSWSTTNRTPGSLFASDLKVARSQDGGQTFEAPVQVNDDGLPISHTFEDLATGHGSDLYLAWLDGRGKDHSGAGCSLAAPTIRDRPSAKILRWMVWPAPAVVR